MIDPQANTGPGDGSPSSIPPPPGYSENDLVDTPPMSAGVDTSAVPPPPGYSASDLVDSRPTTPAKPHSTLTMNDGDGTALNLAKGGLGVLSGIGEGLFSTVAGVADLAQLPSTYLHKLAGDDEEQSNAEKVGYGGETLMEFLLGDEALKGLSTAKKLDIAAKTAKTLEGSPRIMTALQIGARVTKTAAASAARAAAVQGAQTFVRSGGDVGKAETDAAGTGVLTGAIGAGLGTVGEIANATGATAKAAQVISDLSERAKNAVSEEGVFSPLGKIISASRDAIDNIFSKAQTDSEAAQQAATVARDKALGETADTKAQQTIDVEAGHGVNAQAAKEAHDAAVTAANDGLTASKQTLHSDLVGALDAASQGGVAPEETATLLNDAINKAREGIHTTYEEGITGENGLETLLGNIEPTAIKGSNMSKAAKDVLANPVPEDHPGVSDLSSIAGDNLKGNVKAFLEKYATGEETEGTSGPKEKTAIGGPAVTTPIPPANIHDLVGIAEAARKSAATFPFGDPNQKALEAFRQGVLKDIDAMAASSPNPEASTGYAALRDNYRKDLADLGSTSAQKLRLNKPDKALGDAAKWLRTGGNVPGKLDVIGRQAGPDVMATIAKSDVQSLKDAATQDPDKFVKDWNNPKTTPQIVKDKFYGQELSSQIQDAVDNYRINSDYAEQKAADAISDAKANLGDTLTTNDVNKGIGLAHADTTAADSTKAIKDSFDTATKQISDALKTAKETNADALGPYKGGFMQDLAEGRVNKTVLNGQIDLQDVRKLKDIAGDKWSDFADGLFQRALSDTNGSPEKVLDWWNGMKPDVRSEMFSTSDPKVLQHYEDTIKTIGDTVDTRRLFKNLVLYPTAAVAASVPALSAYHAAGHTVLMELLGAMGTAGFGASAPKLVNYVAEHPMTWKALSAVSKASPAIARAASTAAANAPGLGKAVAIDRDLKRNVYSGASSALTGTQ